MGASPDRRREKMQPTLATTQPEPLNWKKICWGAPLPTRRLLSPKRSSIGLYKPHENKLPDIEEKKNNPVLSPETKT